MDITVAELRAEIEQALVAQATQSAREKHEEHNTRNTELILQLLTQISEDEAPLQAEAVLEVLKRRKLL